MLYVNEIREAAKTAKARFRLALSVNENLIRDPLDPMATRISSEGVQVLQKIVQDVRSNTNPEDRETYWHARTYAPLIPAVVRNNVWMSDPTTESLENAIKWMKDNKMNMQMWFAYLDAIRLEQNTVNDSYQMSVDQHVLDIERWDYLIRGHSGGYWASDPETSDIYKGLKMLMDVKITTNSYKTGIKKYEETITKLNDRLKLQKVSGIAALYQSRPKYEGIITGTRVLKEARAAVRAEALELFGQIKNGLSARTWGFEIEVPDCKGVNAPAGIEKGDDGSLRSDNREDCECDCGDCSYHECDCDYCDNGNSDPQHCGDDYCASGAESAEYRSTGGIQRVLHGGMLKLCEDLVEEDAEMNDSAGTHIHVYAQDLTTNQVGQVLATYHWLYETVFTPIAGRVNNGYSRELKVNDIANALRKHNPVLRAEKPMAVNVTQLISGRGTIEFRQQDCNLDGKLISTWAWLVRGLVEVAKRGATFSNFKSATSLKDVLAVYAKYNFTPQSENPGLVIVGSRSDQGRWTNVMHKVAA